MTMTIAQNIELPDDMDMRLASVARHIGKSKETCVLEAIEEFLEDQEDIANADEVMRGIRAGTVKIYSAEEVRKRLGLED